MRAELGKTPSRAPPSQLNLPPGFRFYPTDEELVVHYLCRKAASEPFAVPIIAEVELYKFNPWDLPDVALFGEREWYFFSPRDRKYPNGSRPNRAAGSGYWKATGTDKPIHTAGTKKVGVKKALVFYKGKAPKGVKTNWIMHEYRLADSAARSAKRKGSLRLDDWVLCRIYKKSSSEKPTPSIKVEPSTLDQQMEDSMAHPQIPTSNVGEMMSFYNNDFANAFGGQRVSSMPQFAQGHNGYNGHMDHTVTASSVELSDHNGFGSRQQSSTPESVTVQEPDDAVESTFTMHGVMPSSAPISGPVHTGRPTPLNVQNCFSYGGPLDATTTSLVSPGTFAGLVDSSDYGFFSSTQDYTSLLTGRSGPQVTSNWDLLRPSQH